MYLVTFETNIKMADILRVSLGQIFQKKYATEGAKFPGKFSREVIFREAMCLDTC